MQIGWHITDLIEEERPAPGLLEEHLLLEGLGPGGGRRGETREQGREGQRAGDGIRRAVQGGISDRRTQGSQGRP